MSKKPVGQRFVFFSKPGKMLDVNDKASHKEEPPASDKKEKFPKVNDFFLKRKKRTWDHKRLNTFLLLIFPVFILTIAEINESQSIVTYVKLWINSPGPMLFALIITSLIFALFLALFKSGFLSVLAHTILYLALSTTEFFKYSTNGNHLIITDMKLFRSVKSLSSFAYVKFTFPLIMCYILAIIFLAIVFYFNPRVEWRNITKIITTGGFVILAVCFVIVPAFYNPVYNAFGIDTTPATNDFLLKEKFKNNGFIAFLVQTLSESYENRITEPENYEQKKIEQILNIKPDTSGSFNGGKKPNVIYIMSESYADFRVFDKLKGRIGDDVYKYFDEACAEGISGRMITPTYASWTVRSEFELMFGLPVKGINDPNMPQRELPKDRKLPAMAHYYKSWGYDTRYIHPFQITFYSRNKIYPNLGFDQLIYHDDYSNESNFSVDVEHYGKYVDDKSDFDELLNQIKTSEKPLYIHTTTMQNHQPYNLGDDPNDEFGNYLQWVQHTNEALHEFLAELKKLDEPTLVFFVGDHFPSLRGETSIYNELDLKGDNCDILYEQTYFIWSNYGADFSSVPKDKFSFFYTQYVIMNIIDAPHDKFIEKMMDYMKKMPVYSTAYDPTIEHDPDLDELTYDRVIGKQYSPSPIEKETEDE